MDREEIVEEYGQVCLDLLDEYAGLADQESQRAKEIEMILEKDYDITIAVSEEMNEEGEEGDKAAYDCYGMYLGSIPQIK